MTGRTKATTSPESPDSDVVTIKKYANRRLYNTATSSYVTLDHLCQMVKDGIDFAVYDAKTGEDITRSVLTQIIVEEEAKGENLLPIGFLRQLIAFYGNNMQMMLPGFLDQSMKSFAENQDRLRQALQNSLEASMSNAARAGFMPFTAFEEISKRNLAMFEQTMRMLTPGAGGGAKSEGGPADSADMLKSWIDALQGQLARMSQATDK